MCGSLVYVLFKFLSYEKREIEKNENNIVFIRDYFIL